MVELTVPWEEGMEAVFKRKKEMHTELSSVCSQAGWTVFTNPVEVDYRAYTETSMQQFLKSLGITATKLRKALKDLAEEAEIGSFWLCVQERKMCRESKDPRTGGRETSLKLLHHLKIFQD